MDNLSPQTVYQRLPNSTTIRILLLAPGEPSDEIFCWLIPSNLECDPRHSTDPNATVEPINLQRLGIFNGSIGQNQEQSFPILFDYTQERSAATTDSDITKHSFQNYEALSYVWGDSANPEHIFLNGSRVPITQNLYNLLGSLRERTNGRRLWADALCINQEDIEEKKDQIALMRRIYQQAERVLAYTPFPLIPDCATLVGLGKLILAAKQECDKARENYNKSVESAVPHLNVGKEDAANLSRLLKGKGKEHQGLTEESTQRKFFLEDFGLPPVDHPLWNTWRNFFGSQYFSRIWILQEFVLAPKLFFFCGRLYIDAAGIINAFVSLCLYSREMNGAYMFPPDHAALESAIDNKIVISFPPVTEMFLQRYRLLEGNPRAKLIECLRYTSRFQATDPKDKIYALLGLAIDGDSYARYVSYAPEETFRSTCLRFARAIIDHGDGFHLLLQIHLMDPVSGEKLFPSWMPRWLEGLGESIPLILSEKIPVRMQVSDDNWTLEIRGCIVDEIEHMCNRRFNSLINIPGYGVLKNFMFIFVRNVRLVFENMDREYYPDVEDVFQELFDVLTQASAAAEYTDPVHMAQVVEKWRAGFKWCLNSLVIVTDDLEKLSDDLFWTGVEESNPGVRMFLERVSSVSAGCCMCITKRKMIALIPSASAKGDRIACFDGCENPFVLKLENGSTGRDGTVQYSDSGVVYTLVGAVRCAKSRLSTTLVPDLDHEDILIV